MPKILTQDLKPSELSEMHNYWVYNALDCCTTSEVLGAIRPLLDNVTRGTYNLSLALQAPALEIMSRGFRVDLFERDAFIKRLESEAFRLQTRLDTLAHVTWGKNLNVSSPKQLKEFFYERLRLPVQYKVAKGNRTPSTDRESLEKLKVYFWAQPFVSHILAIRELKKLASTLRSEVSPDGRMRTSINIAGTETGRFSSTSSAFNEGTNLQNQTERLRRIFIADPGKKLAYVDLEQAESRAVGIICANLGFGDAYLKACSSGDLHTTVCQMVWPRLPWTGELDRDKDTAEQPFYRHFSYRDMAKRGGHGTNYYGQAHTMAKHLKVQPRLIEGFQEAYFEAFPEIRRWHEWVEQQIQMEQELTTLFGRKRIFFGRTDSKEVLRQAIAYEPQSCIGEYTNRGMLRVHHELPEVDILLQVHDALVLQFDEGREAELVPQITELMSSIRLGREDNWITIPTDAMTGWNWGKVDSKKKYWPDGNPFGMKRFRGRDDRKYSEPSLLDRVFR